MALPLYANRVGGQRLGTSRRQMCPTKLRIQLPNPQPPPPNPQPPAHNSERQVVRCPYLIPVPFQNARCWRLCVSHVCMAPHTVGMAPGTYDRVQKAGHQQDATHTRGVSIVGFLPENRRCDILLHFLYRTYYPHRHMRQSVISICSFCKSSTAPAMHACFCAALCCWYCMHCAVGCIVDCQLPSLSVSLCRPLRLARHRTRLHTREPEPTRAPGRTRTCCISARS